MELRHLRYFVAVAEELNYRKAALRLRVAQPSLSRQIKDLEHELGVQLLHRDTRGVQLTFAGNAFLDEARLIVAHAARSVVVVRDAAKGRRGRLTVGYFAPLLMGFMPASLKAFHEKFPDVEVGLIEMPLGDQIAALESGAIQIGFTIWKGADLPCDLEHVEIVRSPIRAVVGHHHRLAGLARVSLAELAREPLASLVLKKGAQAVHAGIMRRVFGARGLKTGPIREIEGADAFRAALESGLAVSLVAEIGSLVRSRDLASLALRETGADLLVELHAMWRGGRASPAVTNFIALMRELAPKELLRAQRSWRLVDAGSRADAHSGGSA